MLCRLTPDTDQRPHISAPTDITLLVSTKLSERKGFIHTREKMCDLKICAISRLNKPSLEKQLDMGI
jgi:hypothetical protein